MQKQNSCKKLGVSIMKRTIFCLMVVLGVIFSLSSVCAADLSDAQAIPSDDFLQMPNDDNILDEMDPNYVVPHGHPPFIYYDNQAYDDIT